MQVALGVALVTGEDIEPPQFHMFYGFVGHHRRRDPLQLPDVVAVGAGDVLPGLRLRRPVPDGPRDPGDGRVLDPLAAAVGVDLEAAVLVPDPGAAVAHEDVEVDGDVAMPLYRFGRPNEPDTSRLRLCEASVSSTYGWMFSRNW